MTAVPIVGILLGALASGISVGLGHTDAPDLLVGLLTVGALALATRGMHIDGLADTADGLGCYGQPERVREVMRSGSAGPFAIATLSVVIGVEAVAIGALVAESRWYDIGFAIALARTAAVVACRWTLRPSSPDGFGALVVGTQRWSIAAWVLLALVAAYPVGGAGFASVAAVGVGAWLFSAHCARRMGGVNGDVLGASIELACAATLVILLV